MVYQRKFLILKINKLILSCAALAAVATTAVSTTYAWYTSNKTVTAGGINASSEDAGAKLLLIADGLQANGQPVATSDLSWQTKIADVNEYQPTNGMVPLSFNGTSLKGLDTATGKTAAAAAENDEDAAGYLHFVLYLRNAATTTGGATVSMTFTQIDNVVAGGTAATWANLPSKAIIKGDTFTNKLSKSTDSSYKVDARRVLAVDIEKTIVDSGSSTTESTHKFNGITYLTGTADASQVAGGSAVDYYNEVMTPEHPLDATSDSTKGTAAFGAAIGLNTAVTDFVTVPSDTAGDASKYVKLDFKVYLDGWDANCYDACQGQYFKFALSFTTA